METKTCSVAIKMDKDKIKIDTNEPLIPTPVVEELVNELTKIISNSIPDMLEDKIKETRNWKMLAIVELIILVLVVLKIKGVF